MEAGGHITVEIHWHWNSR